RQAACASSSVGCSTNGSPSLTSPSLAMRPRSSAKVQRKRSMREKGGAEGRRIGTRQRWAGPEVRTGTRTTPESEKGEVKREKDGLTLPFPLPWPPLPLGAQA